MNKFDHTTDVVVVGSGGGALTAALTTRLAGSDVIVVEKCPCYGGSTALSGGGMWIPNNHKMAEAGIYDSPELALTYMKNLAGDRVPESRLKAYIRHAPEMLKFLCDNTSLVVMTIPNSADYNDLPGSITNGRGVEPVPFNGKLLKQHLNALHFGPQGKEAALGLTIGEAEVITKFKTTGAGKRQLLKTMLQKAVWTVTRGQRLTLGLALISRLRYSMMKLGVPLWLNSPVKRLVVENGVVVGVEIEKDGKPFIVKARKGVILAAGGFAKNQQMREKYLPHPTSKDWSTANVGDTGDAICMGLELDATVDLMDDAWWMPVYIGAERIPASVIFERQLGGSLIVDQTGQRFVNEAIQYSDFGHEVYKRHSDQYPAIPFYYITDQESRNKYIFGRIRPGQKIPKQFYDGGEFTKANTIRELAQRIGINPDSLEQTVKRYNGYARGMKDQEFRKGETPFEHVYADPSAWPNPCLAPIDKAPFYAVKMYPGDIGTRGGLVTDEYARVLSKNGSVIEGLFAVGNTSASVMGNGYAGPGGTIGPSMVFGYIAARYLTGTLK